MRLRALILLLVFGTLGMAQEDQGRTDAVLRVGIKNSPPFVTLRDGFSPEGLSVEFWNQVNEMAKVNYDFIIFESVQDMSRALGQGEIDMSINPITVTEDRMEFMDFSQPYYISGTAVVSPKSSLLLHMLQVVFSFEFLYVIGSIIMVIAIVGLIMWLIERRRNRSMFNSGIKGLGDGMWWSAVTMTTVGYGDKTPRTTIGRIVGFLWMFAAIVLLSGLTAFITSSLTTSSLSEKVENVEDLKKYMVGTVAGTSTESYLEIFDIAHKSYSDVDQALDAIETGETDLVVYDRPILAFQLGEGNYPHLGLSGSNLKTDYYCFTYPKGSKLRNELDPLIVKVLRSNAWNIKLRVTQNF